MDAADLSECLYVKNKINQLRVRCNCNLVACTWTGTLQQRLARSCEHLYADCPLFGVNCCDPHCTGKVPRDTIENHVMKQVNFQTIMKLTEAAKGTSGVLGLSSGATSGDSNMTNILQLNGLEIDRDKTEIRSTIKTLPESTKRRPGILTACPRKRIIDVLPAADRNSADKKRRLDDMHILLGLKTPGDGYDCDERILKLIPKLVFANDHDVTLVVEQTKCSRIEAQRSLSKHDGDVEKAVVELMKNKK